MSKVVTSLAVAAVLLVGSSALADTGVTSGVLHFQDFGTTMLNGVSLMNGGQQADSTNWATIQNNQNSIGSCGVFAQENQTGFFSQVGQACGSCALVDLDQSVLGLGQQQQTIGEGVGPKHGLQNLSLSGNQMVTKADGSGSALAE